MFYDLNIMFWSWNSFQGNPGTFWDWLLISKVFWGFTAPLFYWCVINIIILRIRLEGLNTKSVIICPQNMALASTRKPQTPTEI